MNLRRRWTVERHKAGEIQDRATGCNEVVTLEMAP